MNVAPPPPPPPPPPCDRVISVTVPRGALGITLASAPAAGPDVRIASVRETSSARGVLLPGDVLLEVAGRPVRGLTVEQIAAHFQAHAKNPRAVRALRHPVPWVPPAAAARASTSAAQVTRAAKATKAEPSPKPKEIKKAAPKKKAQSPSKEKRLARHRATPPSFVRERLGRAASQRMYLVHRGPTERDDSGAPSCQVAVLGSTGNLYKVTLGRVSRCNCPDAMKHARKRGGGSPLCKHILFVLLKVAGLDADDPLAFQAALLTEEVERVLEAMERRSGRVGERAVGAMANATVRKAYARKHGLEEEAEADNDGAAAEEEKEKEQSSDGVKRKSPEEQSECLICFDEMDKISPEQFGRDVTYCRGMCGANFHASCIQRWHSSASQLRAMFRAHTGSEGPACPACRSPWLDGAGGGVGGKASPSTRKKRKKRVEGYENFGEEAGLPAERDTSTYRAWSPYYARRRRRW